MTPKVDLSITKTDGVTIANPLDTLTYTIVVANAGPSSVSDAVVLDTVPASLTGVSWTCSAGSGGHCDNTGPTAGNINTTVDLGVGGSVQFTVTGTIVGSTVGSIVNTATVSAPAGVTETNSANNAATDTTAVTSTAALSITKTDGQTTDVAGTSSTYTIIVNNAGPSAVADAGVTDTLPAGLTNATWTCVASGRRSLRRCRPDLGNINTTVDLPAGTSATYTVTGTIDPAFTGVLSNTATVTAPSRHDRQPGRQHGDRHHDDRRPGQPHRHQVRRNDDGNAGHQHHLHGDRRQRRPVDRRSARRSPTPCRPGRRR